MHLKLPKSNILCYNTVPANILQKVKNGNNFIEFFGLFYTTLEILFEIRFS